MIEAVIRDDAETLALYREAMKQQGGDHTTERGKAKCNNVTVCPKPTGNSKAYTLSRLKRDSPELFDRVCKGELTANAAAIEAGFRKKPTAEEQVVRLIRRAEDPRAIFERIRSEFPEYF